MNKVKKVLTVVIALILIIELLLVYLLSDNRSFASDSVNKVSYAVIENTDETNDRNIEEEQTENKQSMQTEETETVYDSIQITDSEVSPKETEDPVFTDTDSYLITANKKHKLPEGYIPEDLVDINAYGCTAVKSGFLRLEAAEHMADMFQAAALDGVELCISSAYRSEDYQLSLYTGYCSQYGCEIADTISSRPGYSDHQTGLAADFIEGGSSDFTQDFENTASGIWLREHAHEFGFIMRYPKDKETITGYAYEPWHFRYIGIEYAEKIYNVDVFESFEEYFGVAGGNYIDS